jgi:uncharacterized protein (TIGR02598 family)
MRKSQGFSLVEVTLAIGIVAFALIAILGLVPVGLNSGRDSIAATHTPLIAQDVFDRIRASMINNDPSPANSHFYFGPYGGGVASFFFYDADGLRTSTGARTGELIKVPFSNDKPGSYSNIKNSHDFYRAKVTVEFFDQGLAYPAYDPRTVSGGNAELLCATIEIGWPVNTQDGSIVGSANKKAVYTFFLRKP